MTANNSNIKLLLIIDSLQMGGAERMVVDAANYLARNNMVQVFVLTCIKDKGGLEKELDKLVSYTFICCAGLNLPTGLAKIRNYILKNKITHVHAHLYNSMIYARWATPKHIKLFFTYHNLEYEPKDIFFSYPRILLDKFTIRSRFVSIFVSRPVMNVVHQSRGRCGYDFVLYNYSSAHFRNLYKLNDQAELKLVSTGNVKPVKNFGYLLQAFEGFKTTNVSLDIYGTGTSMTELQEYINTHALSNVRLKGKAAITSAMLAQYDAFVMSSISEGMPVALIEAMVTGMPSILPGHLKVMHDVAADSAFYFDLSDISSFQKIITALCANKELLRGMSEKAAKYSLSYSVEAHMGKLMEIYTL